MDVDMGPSIYIKKSPPPHTPPRWGFGIPDAHFFLTHETAGRIPSGARRGAEIKSKAERRAGEMLREANL